MGPSDFFSLLILENKIKSKLYIYALKIKVLHQNGRLVYLIFIRFIFILCNRKNSHNVKPYNIHTYLIEAKKEYNVCALDFLIKQ